jgi:hypothetical protein
MTSKRAIRAIVVAAAGATLAACVLGSGENAIPPAVIDAGHEGITPGTDASGRVDANVPPPADAAIDATDATNPEHDAEAPDASDASDAGDAAEASVDAADVAVVSALGCADGTREGFASAVDYPRLAGCSGAWSVPGIIGARTPACARAAGNDGTNATGAGCGVADLCAAGWHVCATSAEVGARTAAGCNDATVDGGAPLFFATGQSGAGVGGCTAGANDLFGCGNIGGTANGTCAPLTRFSNNLCSMLGAPWSCGADGLHEADNVTKTATAGGGVLCCRDD